MVLSLFQMLMVWQSWQVKFWSDRQTIFFLTKCPMCSRFGTDCGTASLWNHLVLQYICTCMVENYMHIYVGFSKARCDLNHFIHYDSLLVSFRSVQITNMHTGDWPSLVKYLIFNKIYIFSIDGLFRYMNVQKNLNFLKNKFLEFIFKILDIQCSGCH